MTSIELHRRALGRATEVVMAVPPQDLARPTPCAGWDLGTLLAHMTGQNVGFATAVIDDEPALADFAPLPHGGWPASAEALTAALAAAPEDRAVLLAEIHPTRRFPLRAVVGMHLLDTVVHTWDVTTALGAASARTTSWSPPCSSRPGSSTAGPPVRHRAPPSHRCSRPPVSTRGPRR